MNILSLGAGVQSTALLLMAEHGEITPRPDYAIFADTGWEPKGVYEHLERLKGWTTIPILTVSAGNIREDTLDFSKRAASLPYFIKKKTGKVIMSGRQCTYDYKIAPINRKIRELLGYGPRGPVPEGAATVWKGISWDEVHRVKDNGPKYIRFRYPLVEKRIDRVSCVAWMLRNGYPSPPKSACIGCPFHDNVRWLQMKQNDPESWADAVDYDRRIRNNPKFKAGQVYLHRQGVPLEEADINEDQGTLDFGEECTGFCGV